MQWQNFFMNPAVVWILIPVSYITLAGIQALYRAYCEHVERMAMIAQGIVPPERKPEADECCAG